MFVFVYSSYHLKLSFLHLVIVILTILETPKTPNIKTAAKQVWLYFIHRTTWPGYASTTTNLQIVLNTQKNPYLNQATQKKILDKFSCPKKSQNRNFKPKKILQSPLSLEIQRTPPGEVTMHFSEVK